ncbi:hypothetical protein V8F06_005617 [Rhypophila decipiens]
MPVPMISSSTAHQLGFITAAKMIPKPEPKREQDQDEREAQQGDQYSTVGSETTTSPFNTPPSSPSISSEVADVATTALTRTAETIPLIRDATPYPGDHFIILHKPTNRAIILDYKWNLRLGPVHDFSSTSNLIPVHGHCNEYGAEGSSECQWLCVEHNGWLGFRSPVGRFIGRVKCEDCKEVVSPGRALEVRAKSHGVREYFCARRHPRGGYILMMPGDNTELLLKVEVAAGTCDDRLRGLVLREDGGALWEFVKVDGIIC